MGAVGRKPKEDRSQVVHKNPTYQFTEYPNVPNPNPPELRPRATGGVSVMAVGAANDSDYPEATKGWWRAISRMPHTVDWTETDWEYAMDTAEVHARTMEAWRGYTGAELRQREKLLGNTMDARRDLRIKYVDPPTDQPLPADVPRLDDYRSL